jgi:hypothetical protein
MISNTFNLVLDETGQHYDLQAISKEKKIPVVRLHTKPDKIINGPTYDNPAIPNDVDNKQEPRVKPSYETKSTNSNVVAIDPLRSNQRMSRPSNTSLIPSINANSI